MNISDWKQKYVLPKGHINSFQSSFHAGLDEDQFYFKVVWAGNSNMAKSLEDW